MVLRTLSSLCSGTNNVCIVVTLLLSIPPEVAMLWTLVGSLESAEYTVAISNLDSSESAAFAGTMERTPSCACEEVHSLIGWRATGWLSVSLLTPLVKFCGLRPPFGLHLPSMVKSLVVDPFGIYASQELVATQRRKRT